MLFGDHSSRRLLAWLPTALLAAAMTAGAFAPDARSAEAETGLYCSQTARAARNACRNEINDDFWIAVGNCTNVSDPGERSDCLDEAADGRMEGRADCGEQYGARLDVCAAIGEDRYDPDLNPANFVDPDQIGGGVAPNPYFSLVVGNQWIFEGGDETITVVVTDKTKLIAGVTCRVVNDVVEDDGVVVEDTDDWYAQDLAGNVWYFGESARDFETFAGDNPVEPELVEIDGSWKAGRDRAKPGIIFFAAPQVGVTYREEIDLGGAEDMAEILSVTGTESAPAASCTNDCLVTRNFTPIEPGVEETKYYAPGVGLILEVDDDGNRVELVDIMP